MTNFDIFDEYRRNFTRDSRNSDYCDVDYLLRFWRQAKGEYLQPLFGDELILERSVEYNRPAEETARDVSAMLEEHYNDIRTFRKNIIEAFKFSDFYADHSINAIVIRHIFKSLDYSGLLISNSVELGDIWDDIYCHHSDMAFSGYHSPIKVEIDGRTLFTLQEGSKYTRLLGQLAKISHSEEIWERLRVAHAQCMNQKKLKGTLCLSIHPMDFATASDNANGWSSCMSWEDSGCYRMGTVEMMNSPKVICAYLKSDKQNMNINGMEWNSKKWRAWIIVTKDAIVCNRHYPYHQENFAIECVNWVRDLVFQHYGWVYDDTHTNFYEYMADVDCKIEFQTNFMYNDLGGDDVIGCLNIKHHNPGKINFSGVAECMVCGKEIAYDSYIDADRLECCDCNAEFVCDKCGRVISSEDDVYYGPNGEVMCEDCYSEYCTTCTNCEETCWTDDCETVYMPFYEDRAEAFLNAPNIKNEVKERFTHWLSHRYNFRDAYGIPEVELCPYCAKKYDLVNVTLKEENGSNLEGMNLCINPLTTPMDKAFRLFDARGYSWANSIWSHRGDHKEEIQQLDDFWKDQWDAYCEDFAQSLEEE